jgi:hypothetical protein
MKRQSILSNRKLAAFTSAIVLASASVLPMLLPNVAQAAQMTRRRVEMSSSIVSSTATGDFVFQLPSGTIVQGIEIEMVDSPLGSYASAPSFVPAIGTPTATLLDATSTSTLSGTTGTAVNGDTFRAWTDTTAFTATKTDGTSFTGTAGTALNQIHLVRSSATSETLDATTSVHAIRVGGLTNNATANKTFFARVRVYAASTVNGAGQFNGSIIHDGTVAGSTAQVLTVQARVQEVLQFCIGAETSAIVSAWSGVGTSCTNVTGTLVDLGAIDSSVATVSPISSGNNSDGIAMLRTNAVNGATVTYKSIQDLTAGGSNRGSLKIVGQTCGSTDISSGSKTDRCFNSTLAGNPLSATSTEGFGMRLVNVDTASETPTANLTASSPYSSGTDYSWDDTGASVLIASSTSASEKVVDDEAFQLRFAARSALTTPTGQYSVQAQFIAAPVY